MMGLLRSRDGFRDKPWDPTMMVKPRMSEFPKKNNWFNHDIHGLVQRDLKM